MYTFLIILVLVASVLVILAVLAQSPKSGMAANFGASNQVMGVRQTADFLEKFTWTLAGIIFALSLLTTVTTPGSGNSANQHDKETVNKTLNEQNAAAGDIFQQMTAPLPAGDNAEAATDGNN